MTIEEQIKQLEQKKKELKKKQREKDARELAKYADIIDTDVLQKWKNKIGKEHTVTDYTQKDVHGNFKQQTFRVTKEAVQKALKRKMETPVFDEDDFK